MAIAFVQQATEIVISGGTSGNTTVTGVGAGNLLMASTNHLPSDTRTMTLADDQDGAWALAVKEGTTRSSQIDYQTDTGGGDTLVTVTINITSTSYTNILEASGADLTTPLDQTSGISEGAPTATHHCSLDSTVIDTAADVLIMAVGTIGAAAGTLTEGSGYTDMGVSVNTQLFAQYQTFATAQVDHRGTFTSVETRQGRHCIASFVGAAAAPEVGEAADLFWQMPVIHVGRGGGG